LLAARQVATHRSERVQHVGIVAPGNYAGRDIALGLDPGALGFLDLLTRSAQPGREIRRVGSEHRKVVCHNMDAVAVAIGGGNVCAQGIWAVLFNILG
jgi:hypothetical protein